MGNKQKIQKTHKSKMLCSGWMQDMEKWFGRWDVTHLLHNASLDSSVNEAFLQHCRDDFRQRQENQVERTNRECTKFAYAQWEKVNRKGR